MNNGRCLTLFISHSQEILVYNLFVLTFQFSPLLFRCITLCYTLLLINIYVWLGVEQPIIDNFRKCEENRLRKNTVKCEDNYRKPETLTHVQAIGKEN